VTHNIIYKLPQPTPTEGAGAFRLFPFTTEAGPLKVLEGREGKRPQRSPWWTLCVAPIVLALLGAVAAFQGTLVSPVPLREMIFHDLKAAFGVNRDPAIPEFPLLRDTASLMVTTLLLLCLPQLSKQ
jgi:hypothetical protein